MIERCVICHSDRFSQNKVLWPALVSEWRLSDEEAAYIERQQGFHCDACGCNMRTQAVALAIMRAVGVDALVSFDVFTRSPGAHALDILEVNACGELGIFLRRMRGHAFVEFPKVQMEALPFADGAFHLVVHSDTLEHVEHPVRALAECRRVLKEGGSCAFTVPLVVGRLTSSREGLAPSYHQSPSSEARDEGMRVRTEFGADAWRTVVEAGFAEARIVSLEFPAALAVVGVR